MKLLYKQGLEPQCEALLSILSGSGELFLYQSFCKVNAVLFFYCYNSFKEKNIFIKKNSIFYLKLVTSRQLPWGHTFVHVQIYVPKEVALLYLHE